MALSKFPIWRKTINDILLETLTEEEPMRIDFKKADATIFVLQMFLNSLKDGTPATPHHVDFHYDLLTDMRLILARAQHHENHEPEIPTEIPEQAAVIEKVRKIRGTDKGKMSLRQRHAIGLKMKAYWKKRRRDEKRVGR